MTDERQITMGASTEKRYSSNKQNMDIPGGLKGGLNTGVDWTFEGIGHAFNVKKPFHSIGFIIAITIATGFLGNWMFPFFIGLGTSPIRKALPINAPVAAHLGNVAGKLVINTAGAAVNVTGVVAGGYVETNYGEDTPMPTDIVNKKQKEIIVKTVSNPNQ